MIDLHDFFAMLIAIIQDLIYKCVSTINALIKTFMRKCLTQNSHTVTQTKLVNNISGMVIIGIKILYRPSFPGIVIAIRTKEHSVRIFYFLRNSG